MGCPVLPGVEDEPGIGRRDFTRQRRGAAGRARGPRRGSISAERWRYPARALARCGSAASETTRARVARIGASSGGASAIERTSAAPMRPQRRRRRPARPVPRGVPTRSPADACAPGAPPSGGGGVRRARVGSGRSPRARSTRAARVRPDAAKRRGRERGKGGTRRSSGPDSLGATITAIEITTMRVKSPLHGTQAALRTPTAALPMRRAVRERWCGTAATDPSSQPGSACDGWRGGSLGYVFEGDVRDQRRCASRNWRSGARRRGRGRR